MTAAQDAAGLLLDDRPGVFLIGPPLQTDRAIRLIVERLSDQGFIPVTITLSDSTPDALRRKVGKAHGSRTTADSDLLLIVPHGDHLSPELMNELDVAAEAASEHGGLKFLIAAADNLEPETWRADRPNLAACVRTRFRILPAPPRPRRDPPDQPEIFPATLALLPNEAALAHAARPAPRIMLAITVLAVLALILVAGIMGRVPARPELRTASLTPPRPVVTPVEPLPMPAPLPLSSPAVRLPSTPEPQPVVQPFALHASEPLPAAIAVPPPEAPAISTQRASLLLMAGPGDTLPSLFKQVYRGTTPPPYDMVAALNPSIHVGMRLVFPAPAEGWPSAAGTTP